MSRTKNMLENLSVSFGYGGEINDDVIELAHKYRKFCYDNKISGFSELTKIEDWKKFADELAEQFDSYGRLNGSAITSHTPPDSLPELAVLFMFDEGIVAVDLNSRKILYSTDICLFE